MMVLPAGNTSSTNASTSLSLASRPSGLSSGTLFRNSSIWPTSPCAASWTYFLFGGVGGAAGQSLGVRGRKRRTCEAGVLGNDAWMAAQQAAQHKCAVTYHPHGCPEDANICGTANVDART